MKFIVLLCLIAFIRPAFAQNTVPEEKAKHCVIEGTLLQVSKLPAPKNNPYPDCYYTAVVEIAHIISGQSIPKRVVLVIPGFFSRKYVPEANFKVGNKIHATVVTFASMPYNVRQTQQADDIEDVEMDFYFAEKITSIQKIKQIAASIPFSVKQKTTEGTSNTPPADLKAKTARKEKMERDLAQINKLLAEHGGDWDKWYDSLSSFRAQYEEQNQRQAKQWVGDSFFSAGRIAHGQGAYNPEFVKAAILFKDYLAKRNIDLILVRWPFKGEVVDDLFATLPAGQVSNPYILRMYKELLEADVEIVGDIIPRAKASRLKYPLMYWYQDFQEDHPAEGMVWVMAEALADRLGRYEKISRSRKATFKIGPAAAEKLSRPASSVWGANNVFWPAGNPKFKPAEYAQFAGIQTEDGKYITEQDDSGSPVLMLGSSYVRSPSSWLGASVSTYLAYLGVLPDAAARLGSDVNVFRSVARDADTLLKNRTVCVFPMTPWTFYQGLEVPPVYDADMFVKTPLASFSGTDLQKAIQVSPETPKHVFSYNKDGSMTVQAADRVSRDGAGGSFSISLPKEIKDFPNVMAEVVSGPGDGIWINGIYDTQQYKITKYFQATAGNSLFVFKSSSSATMRFEVNNLQRNFPSVITGINIYGCQPKSGSENK